LGTPALGIDALVERGSLLSEQRISTWYVVLGT
jgi:hypothetical protein